MLLPAARRFPSPPGRHPRLSAPLHACSESRCAGPPIVVLRAQCPLVLIAPTCEQLLSAFDEQERGGTTMIGKSLAHLTYWGMCTVNGPPPTRFVAFNSGDGKS